MELHTACTSKAPVHLRVASSFRMLNSLHVYDVSHSRMSAPLDSYSPPCRDLSGQGLTGPIPPADLAQMTGLTHLYVVYEYAPGPSLSKHLFYGIILSQPSSCMSLSFSSHTRPFDLFSLRACRDLYNNALTGPLPDEIGLLANLSVIRIYGNALSGQITDKIGLLKKLNTLYVTHLSLPLHVVLHKLLTLLTVSLSLPH